MKFLFAPDSFKGSLSSVRAIELLTEAARRHFPDCQVIGIPMADGGEGTVEALLDTLKGTYEVCTVSNPVGKPVEAKYALTNDHTAIIEMAAASGLPLVFGKDKNPLYANSYGTGELIKDAIKKGARKLLLSIGGSATNDGGIGVAAALGIRFLDENGQELQPIGKNLIHIASIDPSGLLEEVKNMDITIMCDVKNPLTGPKGATYVYGAQKGGSPIVLDRLEEGMVHYASIIKELTGTDYSSLEGTGAAGGFSVPFLAFTNAKLASGIDSVLSILEFDKQLEGVDLVVTGEGRVDGQSIFGKVLAGVGGACAKRNVPACAIVGGMGPGASAILNYGIDSILPIVPGPIRLSESLAHTEEYFLDAADRMFRFIKIGTKFQ